MMSLRLDAYHGTQNLIRLYDMNMLIKSIQNLMQNFCFSKHEPYSVKSYTTLHTTVRCLSKHEPYSKVSSYSEY